jgi:hypothetical protein
MHPRNYDADCRATVFSTSAHPNPDGFAQPKTGLSTGVVKALSRQKEMISTDPMKSDKTGWLAGELKAPE